MRSERAGSRLQRLRGAATWALVCLQPRGVPVASSPRRPSNARGPSCRMACGLNAHAGSDVPRRPRCGDEVADVLLGGLAGRFPETLAQWTTRFPWCSRPGVATSSWGAHMLVAGRRCSSKPPPQACAPTASLRGHLAQPTPLAPRAPAWAYTDGSGIVHLDFHRAGYGIRFPAQPNRDASALAHGAAQMGPSE